MKGRIYGSLLFMGIIAIILTFAVSTWFYYQEIRDHTEQELSHLTALAAEEVTGDPDSDAAYFEHFANRSGENLRISLIRSDGTVVYESAQNVSEDYRSAPEVKKALAGRVGIDVRNENGQMTCYYARLLKNGEVLRLSSASGSPFPAISSAAPGLIGLFVIFLPGCMLAARKLTTYLLRPLRNVGTAMEEIMNGRPGTLIAGYSELEPLIAKVRNQKEQIQNYLRDIEEDRNMIRTIVDTISDGIILLDDKREILEYNETVKTLFSLKEDVHYRPIAVVYHDADWLRAIGRSWTKDRRVYTMEIAGKPFEATLTRAKLSETMTGTLIVLRDLTARYETEKMRREFSANVSHELKTPLTSISGFAEMIAAGMYEQPDDVKLFGSHIYEESRRLLALIDTIMHLSKIEERATTITWKPVFMKDVVQHAADILQPQAEQEHVTISLDLQPIYVYGNASLLSELVMNLLDNAVKYNRENGTVLLSVRAADQYMVMTVSDTGIGISEEKQKRVFERFYRADESRNKSISGTGLGLSICKHIVTQHHGTVVIKSTEGEGTTVTVMLPRMSDKELSSEETTEANALKEAAAAQEAEKQEKEKEPEAGQASAAACETASVVHSEVRNAKNGKERKEKKEKKEKNGKNDKEKSGKEKSGKNK